MASKRSTETVTIAHCRKARRRELSFDCKLNRGHEGNCTPFTLRPMASDEWEAFHGMPAGSDPGGATRLATVLAH
jgi:hypothetical protein